MTNDERTRRAEQGRRIRMARNAIPLSQGELAEKVSAETGDPISRTIIAQIEAGNRDVETGILFAIASVTGLSREWLLGDREIPGYVDPWANLPLSTGLGSGYLKSAWGDALTPAIAS